MTVQTLQLNTFTDAEVHLLERALSIAYSQLEATHATMRVYREHMDNDSAIRDAIDSERRSMGDLLLKIQAQR